MDYGWAQRGMPRSAVLARAYLPAPAVSLGEPSVAV